eukprot:TRINITY_DN4083_c0_g1_i6.p1 TRINITY_DN4083_c0_g1~~TRINITY_DN4083_c0_g1_i6.p1  ORF type:complete len:713 (+),score=184.11 TRINITY_DN4083_c0_g1_i6:944-3082(+)
MASTLHPTRVLCSAAHSAATASLTTGYQPVNDRFATSKVSPTMWKLVQEAWVPEQTDLAKKLLKRDFDAYFARVEAEHTPLQTLRDYVRLLQDRTIGSIGDPITAEILLSCFYNTTSRNRTEEVQSRRRGDGWDLPSHEFTQHLMDRYYPFVPKRRDQVNLRDALKVWRAVHNIDGVVMGYYSMEADLLFLCQAIIFIGQDNTQRALFEEATDLLLRKVIPTQRPPGKTRSPLPKVVRLGQDPYHPCTLETILDALLLIKQDVDSNTERKDSPGKGGVGVSKRLEQINQACSSVADYLTSRNHMKYTFAKKLHSPFMAKIRRCVSSSEYSRLVMNQVSLVEDPTVLFPLVDSAYRQDRWMPVHSLLRVFRNLSEPILAHASWDSDAGAAAVSKLLQMLHCPEYPKQAENIESKCARWSVSLRILMLLAQRDSPAAAPWFVDWGGDLQGLLQDLTRCELGRLPRPSTEAVPQPARAAQKGGAKLAVPVPDMAQFFDSFFSYLVQREDFPCNNVQFWKVFIDATEATGSSDPREQAIHKIMHSPAAKGWVAQRRPQGRPVRDAARRLTDPLSLLATKVHSPAQFLDLITVATGGRLAAPGLPKDVYLKAFDRFTRQEQWEEALDVLWHKSGSLEPATTSNALVLRAAHCMCVAGSIDEAVQLLSTRLADAGADLHPSNDPTRLAVTPAMIQVFEANLPLDVLNSITRLTVIRKN